MNNIYNMDEIIKNVDIFMQENKTIYKDINITEILLPYVYINYFKKKETKETNNLKKKIKKIIKQILLYFPNKSCFVQKNNFSFKCKYKYLFSFGFSMTDYRHSILLINVIKKLDKQDVLIITDKQDVFYYYKKRNYSIIFLNVKKFASENNKIINNNFNNIKIRWILGKSIPIINYLDFLYSKVNIDMVISSQDFHIFDQINTKLGNKNGFKTITHQHGMINEPHPGLYKYIFSDKIFLWGNNSKKRLESFVDKDKLLISGTTKFNYLFSKSSYKKTYISMAINPVSKELNKKITIKFLDLCRNNLELDNKFKFVLKLHPSLNTKYWSNFINYYDNELNIMVAKNNNKEILNKSKILIAYKSTISLEAMICGCSVIELDFRKQDNKKLLFNNLKNSIKDLNELEKEVKKRLKNDKYNNSILRKQNKVVNNEIETFNIEYELLLLSKI